MKEFDLEAAKNGAPVVTRDGKAARIICFDRKDNEHPIIALVDEVEKEECYSYTKNGKLRYSGEFSVDLFMAPVKKKGWINLYPYSGTVSIDFPITRGVFESKEKADEVDAWADAERMACIEIEWEE